MIQKIKNKLEHLLFKKYQGDLKVRVVCDKAWYGNENAGFYICPSLINEDSIVYSFGIGEDISFDLKLIEIHNCTVFGFDPTPKSINWVSSLKLPNKFKFYDFGLSSKTGTVVFYLPKNNEYVSGSMTKQSNVNLSNKINVNVKTISDTTIFLKHQSIDLLKMDIEGAEYEVISDFCKSSIFVKQIVLELHDRYVKNGNKKSHKLIKQLYNKGYRIFAISASKQEVSFIHESLIY